VAELCHGVSGVVLGSKQLQFTVFEQREQELAEGDVGLSLTRENAGRKEEGEKREMITPALREALTKQGEVL